MGGEEDTGSVEVCFSPANVRIGAHARASGYTPDNKLMPVERCVFIEVR